MTDKPIKKASELLVEMDQKIDNILAIVRNQDNLIKILLNKISKQSSTTILEIPQIKSEVKSISENTSSDDMDFPQVKDNIEFKKIAVQQQVTYKDNKNICLATVEILDLTGKSIKKLKTNAMGRWITVLEPGNYVVKIHKSANNNKAKIELSYNFNIDASEKIVELPVLSE